MDSRSHYEAVVRSRRRTRFVRCGYSDRFDPFVLNKDPRLRGLYDRLFREFLGGLPPGRLLDVGAGTGVYFDALAGHAREIEALDPSAEMVGTAADYCRAAGLRHIHPRVGSGEDLPFGDGEFDVVIALDTLHHVPDAGRVTAEVHRVLKPEGRFFVFEPNICNPLMFLAHALPREERRAVRRNRPAVLRRSLEPMFETLRWQGVSAMITRSGGLKNAFFQAYLKAWEWTRLEALYTRQAWLGRKRTVPCASR